MLSWDPFPLVFAMIAVPLQSESLICPHQIGDSCDVVVTPDDRAHWFSCPLSVQQVVPLLSRGQRGKPVMVVLPCTEAQMFAKMCLFLETPHANFRSLHMTTSHRLATENSTLQLHLEHECYPQCPGERGPGPSVLRRFVGSSVSDPERLRRPWS